MARGKLPDYLQVGGNLGLIAGLILVGVQIIDSNRIASAELFGTSVGSAIGLYGDAELVSPEGFVGPHFEFFACPYGPAWPEQQIELLATESNEELPIVKSLRRMRELAAAESASARLEDSLKRVEDLLAQAEAS
ncbi:MAG: hypothetical protein GWM88_04805 [Pseudomonadales bacterium]|nr:hypothetical protein [Pseudomonadales bacterium]NIX07361.1 hypothetical protein [Pseudomonadales bacterium]